MFWIGVLIVALMPVLAQIVGAVVARGLWVPAGRGREVMPSLAPTAARGDLEAFSRAWLRRRRAVEARLVKRFAGGVEGAEAEHLSAALGVPEALVAAALAHLREAVPCRLRVTRGGRLLHDFRAVDLARWRSRRRWRWPGKLLVFVVAALANVGAAWPVLLGGGVAVATLVSMWTSEEDALWVGVGGLVTVAVLAAATLGLGAVLGWLLSPLGGAPRLGETTAPEAEAPRPTEAEPSGGGLRAAIGRLSFASAASGSGRSRKRPSKSSSSSSSSSKFDLPDDARAVLVVVVVALLVAVVAGAFSTLFFWGRGMWRAAFGAEDAPPGTSPARWVRRAHPVSTQEKLLPTNDLVMRLLRALRRGLADAQPYDAELAERVVERSKASAGWISALDLVLWEGLAPAEAARVGATLAVQRGGRVELTEQGELMFLLPGAAEPAPDALPGDDLSEFLRRDGLARRDAQPTERLVSNLPGVALGHLVAGHRLVAGSVLMAAVGLWMLTFEDAPLALNLLFSLGLPLLCLACGLLVGVTRHTARTTVRLGVLRDLRRAGLHGVRQALGSGAARWEAEKLVSNVHEALAPAWPTLSVQAVQREVQAVAFDLDLETDLDSGMLVWPMAALRARRAHVAAAAEKWRASDAAAEAPADDEEVIFDTGVVA